MNISYTMLHTFMQCEYMYKLRYVDRVPLAESSASVYGTAVHESIKAAYENNLTKDELIKFYKQTWIALAAAKDVVFTHEKDYINRLNNGKQMVADYYDTYIDGHQAPKAVELFIGRNSGITLAGHPVIAVFDQIDSDDNVIDYKSGVKPTKFQLDLDLQFTIYSYVYRELYGKAENGLILRHLKTMKDLTTTRTEKDFDILKGEVVKVEKKLDKGGFVRNLGRDCANCYFLEHCLGKERPINRW